MFLTRRAFTTLLPSVVLANAVPKRRWTIYVVQHSHIDNGFTERQEMAAEYHAQFVRQAVHLARSPKQKHRSPETRFKFTFEGFWAVEQFLRTASQPEKQWLIEGLQAGDLEISASYFNMVDLGDAELMRQSVAFASNFGRDSHVPLKVAMCCDVNGISWALAEAFAQAGVSRLAMNINPDQGGYPFGKPLVPFLWETPDEQELLVWNGLAYHKANLFGLMGGSVPAGDPGIPGLILPGMSGYVDVTDASVAEKKLLPFLAWLEETGYPYDFLPLMGSGTYTDNSPPGDAYCRILAEWNTKFGASVGIRTATLTEFFDALDKRTHQIPIYRGDWPNWWDDDAASAPNATALYRNALRNRRLVSLLDSAGKTVNQSELEEIDRSLLAYDEHTFGYSRTALPTLLGEQVFARKDAYATEADAKVGAALDKLLELRGAGAFTADQPFRYTVVNPYPFAKEDVVGLPIHFYEANFLQRGIEVLDKNDRSVPFQVEQVPRGWNVCIRAALHGGENATYRIVPGPKTAPAVQVGANRFTNSFYELEWNADQGIVSYTSGGSNLMEKAQAGFGCPVYQIFPGSDRSQAGSVSGKRVRPREEITFGRCTSVVRVASGDLFETIEFGYSVPGVHTYRLRVRCYHNLPHLELSAQIVKTEVDDPEGLYIYFPLIIQGARWVLDKPGGAMRPGLDQLPGTCCDYYTVLSGAAQAGKDGGVAWVSLDAPLVQIGGLKLWRFTTETDGMGPLYSWITNNKWQTNTRYRCGGGYEMRYRVSFGPDLKSDAVAITRSRELACTLLVGRT